MSHYTTVETEFTDQECLLDALNDIGFTADKVEVHEAAQQLFGYGGDQREQRAHVIIRRQWVGRASNDVGFFRQPDGTFQAIISEFDARHAKWSSAGLGKLKQRYNYHVYKKLAERKGYRVRERQDEKGTIKLTLARY